MKLNHFLWSAALLSLAGNADWSVSATELECAANHVVMSKHKLKCKERCIHISRILFYEALGWKQEHCNQVSTPAPSPPDPCDASPCLNNGTCITTVGISNVSYTCDCTGTGFEGLKCGQDIDECASVETNPCNSTTETCSNAVGGFLCHPNVVCNGMGNASCTEPFLGFFDELSKYGSFRASSMDKQAINTWMKTDIWVSLSMETLLQTVPSQYMVVSTEDTNTTDSEGLLLLSEFMDFLLANRTISPYDLMALQGEFAFNFTTRRHLEEFDQHEWSLTESDDQCNQILTEKAVKVLILCFDAIGIDQSIGEHIVGPLVEANKNTLEPAFGTQFVQHDGLTKGFIASVFIVFLTTIEWWQVEKVVSETFTGFEKAAVLLNVSLDLMALFATGGWVAVTTIDAAMLSMFSLFDDVKDVLQDSCFGDTIVHGCEEFFKSGGYGLTTSAVNMGRTRGDISLTYDMYSVKDEIEVFYEGTRIYWSGGPVSWKHTVDLSFGPGDSKLIVVRINAPYSGTGWDFSVTCPESDDVEGPGDDDDLFSYASIRSAVERKKYNFYDGTYELNLIGIRGPARIAGEYDDTFVVLYKDEQEKERLFVSKHFTTDPGAYYLMNPTKETGCAILTPGQHEQVWVIGRHKDKYAALVQWGNKISVYRDNNTDAILDIPTSVTETDWFGINLHHGEGYPTIGKYSAGCQVFRDEADLLTVLDLAQKQIDYGHSERFSYTLLDKTDLLGSISTVCGDGNCDDGETSENCSEDCPLEFLLTNVMIYFDDLDHQICAVEYLEAEIDPVDASSFTCRFYGIPCGDSIANIDLVEASKHYSGMSNEVDALDTLQSQMESKKPEVFNQFIAYWRKKGVCDPGPGGGCPSFSGYVFWPGYDSPLHNLEQSSSTSVADLEALCSAKPNCKGFNTNGSIKSHIEPLGEWQMSMSGPCQGLYIKKPTSDDFVVNGNPLRPREISMMKWVAKETVPNLGMLPYDAILNHLGPGVWWSLKEGVLNLENPYMHSNCNGTKLGPLQVCNEGLEWQIGIASVQVNYWTSETWVENAENKAKEYYNDDISLALSETVKWAGYSSETETYITILADTASPGYLRTSWLFRNHLVGFYWKGKNVKESCVDTSWEWCYKSYCESCTRYALENIASVRDAIKEVTILLQSLYDDTADPTPPTPTPPTPTPPTPTNCNTKNTNQPMPYPYPECKWTPSSLFVQSAIKNCHAYSFDFDGACGGSRESDHWGGNAMDVYMDNYPAASGKMPTDIQKAEGDKLVAWLAANAADLQVHYILWRGRIWNVERQDEGENGWRTCEGPEEKNPDCNTCCTMWNGYNIIYAHYDHIHVQVYGGISR